MFNRGIITTLLCLFIALASACRNSQPPAGNGSAEAKPPPLASASAQQQPSPQEAPPVSPPASAAELRATITRTYRDAVMIDGSRPDSFVEGDFNGDNSPDIAIVVKPEKGMLSQLNDEYANWIVEDPHNVMQLDASKDVQPFPKKPAPVKVRQGDILLAVIHGYQKAGWRDLTTTQTYLLRNAVGDEMTMQGARSLLNASAGKGQLPPLRGDVIRETLAGTPGFIYWTGAKYAWHPTTASN